MPWMRMRERSEVPNCWILEEWSCLPSVERLSRRVSASAGVMSPPQAIACPYKKDSFLIRRSFEGYSFPAAIRQGIYASATVIVRSNIVLKASSSSSIQAVMRSVM